jgi:SulP family sulfate permease
MPSHPPVADAFEPKLVTTLKEGYGLAALRADALAGLTVAIVALPLSMAIAIASGVTPDRGLAAAIVGGFFVSALGGSRFQIGGPAGAFIVLVAATVARHGVEGLLLATFLSGFMLMAVGALRLGAFIKYVPYPVTVGFTAGIALIIFMSQLAALIGEHIPGGEPAAIAAKAAALARALPTFSPHAAMVGALTIATILLIRRFRPQWPVYLIAVALASLVALALPGAETIADKFGALPRGLPAPVLPSLSWEKVRAVLPDAGAFALLGAIESLLSAVVADSMSGRRHRSNMELVAQGVANIASAMFGGLVVTGAIARTATNVRAGAHGPVAGMLHSAFLLLFLVFAAPILGYIPLAALAGVLVVVAWNMIERHEIAILMRASRGDAAVLIATFLITVFVDLATGIVVGFGLGALLLLHRLAQSVEVHADAQADEGFETTGDRDIVVYRISGAFFFGAAASVSAALERIGARPKAYVIDFSEVPLVDSTAASTMAAFARRAGKHARVYFVAARPAVLRALLSHGLDRHTVTYKPTIEAAVAHLRGKDADHFGGME